MKILWGGQGLNLMKQEVVTGPPTDYIAYYKFDGDTTDETDTYNLTNVSTTFTTDRFGNVNSSDYMNDLSQYIYYDGHYDFSSGSISISMWIKPNVTDRYVYYFTTYKDTGSEGFRITNADASASQRIRVQHKSGTYYSSYVNASTDWHHIAFTYDATTTQWTLYWDNISVLSRTGTLYFKNPVIDAFFGTNQAINGEFKGGMDDIRIYDRELTDEEVSLLYNETNPI